MRIYTAKYDQKIVPDNAQIVHKRSGRPIVSAERLALNPRLQLELKATSMLSSVKISKSVGVAKRFFELRRRLQIAHDFYR